MTATLIARAQPSYTSGFARSAAESEFPQLWRGLISGWPTGLGATGNQMIDVVRGHHATFNANLSTSSWMRVGGILGVDMVGNQPSTEEYATVGDLDVFTFGSGGNTDTPFSVSLWFACDSFAAGAANFTSAVSKTTSTGTNQAEYFVGAVETPNSFGIRLSDNNGASAYAGCRTGTLTAGQLYHGVATYAGGAVSGDCTTYIDGKYDRAADYQAGSYSGMASTTAPFDIGAQMRGSGSYDEYWDGMIANVFIWDRCLSAHEVSLLYQYPLAPFVLKHRPAWYPSEAPPAPTLNPEQQVISVF